jgi:uncharacterized protein
MGNPFQDQLLKAGLVSKQQVRQAKTEKKKARQHAGDKAGAVDEIKLEAERARQEKAERDRELNRQKLEQEQQKQIVAQVRQLIEMNRVDIRDGEIAYNFEDDKVVRRLFVTDSVQKQIINGRLAIVRLDGQYEVVPRPVADKIRQRDADCIVVSNDRELQREEDDAYADYQIPDDLMW